MPPSLSSNAIFSTLAILSPVYIKLHSLLLSVLLLKEELTGRSIRSCWACHIFEAAHVSAHWKCPWKATKIIEILDKLQNHLLYFFQRAHTHTTYWRERLCSKPRLELLCHCEWGFLSFHWPYLPALLFPGLWTWVTQMGWELVHHRLLSIGIF